MEADGPRTSGCRSYNELNEKYMDLVCENNELEEKCQEAQEENDELKEQLEDLESKIDQPDEISDFDMLMKESSGGKDIKRSTTAYKI